LKESTKKLCRQLQKKPDVEGNSNQVKGHNKSLVKIIGDVAEEMITDVTFSTYRSKIDKELEEQT